MASGGWRLIVGDGCGGTADPGRAAAAGSRNMAVDHALFDAVRAGGPPVLRLYRWQPACLSLGRNQHARGLYDEAALRDAGLDVVRRPTGGLAVLHDDELTYCVLAPAALLGGPRAAYRRINEALVRGLARLGVAATSAESATAPDPRADAAAPCFQAPASGEVVAAGRKLVGSAQRCERQTLLQHGSILRDGSQARLLTMLSTSASAAAAAAAPPDAGAITLRQLLGAPPSWYELIEAVRRGFEEMCGTSLAPGTLDAGEAARAAELERLYGAASWTWRL